MDNDGVCGNIDNCLSVANATQSDANGNGIGDACDPTDSDGDGFSDQDEVAAGSDPVMPTSVPALTVAATPATIATDSKVPVKLTLTPVVPGDTLTVEQILDVDNDGVVDADEPALRSFSVTDGVLNANPNVLADSDGVADGLITVVLNLRDARDIHHLPGNFLFWASDGSRVDTTAFAVTATLGSQSVSGTVTDGTNPVPGALVTLQGKGFTGTPYGAFANGTGEYRIEVPVAGDYHVIAEDYTGQRVTTLADGNPQVTVGTGQHMTGINRTLTAGTVTIGGNAGAPGVKVVADSATAHGQVLANADGTYQLTVPAGSYEVRVQPTDHLGLHPSSKGLLGQEGYSQTVNATTNLTGINFTLTAVAANVSGTVRDEFGVAMEGMHVDAINTSDPTLPVAMAVTGTSGAYTIGLNAANPWTLSVMGDKLWVQDRLSSQIDNFSTATGPAAGNDLTVYQANAWITGTVHNAQNQPMAKVEVYGWNGDSSLRTGGTTDTDGTYRLPAKGQMVWTVDALTEEAGQEPVAAQMASLTDGQTATLDFTAPLPTVATPASITVPATDTDGSYSVSWGASTTAGISYVLQEATNNTFTANLRQAYAGTATNASITGRSSGVTYYYRVRATKPNYTVSSWQTAGNGCTVNLPCATPASITVPATNATGSYSVSWGASPTAGVTYVLQEATNNTFTIGLRQAYAGTALTTVITGRSSGVTYYYRVRAQKTGYTVSGYATAANGCVVTLPCVAPASITVPTSDADGSYAVSWPASTTAGVTYELQEATNSTFTVNLRTAYTGTALTTNITGRSQNFTYYYRVRATKTNYTASGYRVAICGCAVPGMAAVVAPASLTVPVANVDGAYTVSWGASTTANVIYELQEATASNFSTGLRTAYRGTALIVNITGRSQNVTYYYRVRAVKAGLKDSGYRGSNSCAVPGTATAGAPASLTVPVTDPDGVYTVSWGASAMAGVTYELHEATNNTFTTGLRLAYRGTTLTTSVTGRTAGTTYYYRVRAVKGGFKDSGFRIASGGCLIGL